MNCANCNKELLPGNLTCNVCGFVNKPQPLTPAVKTPAKGNKIVSIVIILIFVGLGIYNAIRNEGVEKNQEALNILDKSTNYQDAISGFEAALKNVYTDDEKLTILKNLGYAYWVNNQVDEAKDAFNQALTLTDKDSFDFYLVSGEISLLNIDVAKAEENYLKAYNKSPNDYQINSSLGVFYMGLDEGTENYVDYAKALPYNQKAYEVNNASETTIENLAQNHFFLKNYQQSIDLFSKTTLDKKPYNNYMIGLSYLGLEDETNARLYLQKSVDQGFAADPEIVEYLKNNTNN